MAIQLSMIVEITSWAPTVAFRNPAMPAQSAPQSAPTTIASRMWRSGFIPSKDEPIQTAMTAPAMYWPVPPMLKRPHRKANATARPVRISVVVAIRVCCMLQRPLTRSSPVTHGKNQLKPGPVEDGAIGRQRVLPVVTRTTRPPTRNASTAVSTGASRPPAFCATW